jgi:ligand-binding sensor domain-containing protein
MRAHFKINIQSRNVGWLVLLVTYCLNFSAVRAQQPLHINFGDELNINFACYASFADSKGFYWLGSDRGIVRFDGHTFEEMYKTFPSIMDAKEIVFEITEDEKGQIWFATQNNRILHYDYKKDTLVSYLHNDSIQKYLPENSILHGLNVYRGKLQLCFPRFGMYEINKEGKVINRSHKEVSKGTLEILISEHDSRIITSTRNSLVKQRVDSLVFSLAIKGTNEFKEIVRIPFEREKILRAPSVIKATRDKENNLTVSFKNLLFLFKNNSYQKTVVLPYYVRGIYFDDSNRMWIASTAGIKVFNTRNDTILRHTFFPNFPIDFKHIRKDTFGGLMFSPGMGNLVYLPGEKYVTLDEKPDDDWNSIVSFEKVESDIYFVRTTGHIGKYNGDSIQYYFLGDKRPGNYLTRDFLYDDISKELWVLGNYGTFILDQNGNWSDLLPFSGVNMIKNKDGSKWVSTSRGVFLIKNREVVYQSWKNNQEIYATALLEDLDGGMLIGSRSGVWKLKNDTLIKMWENIPELSSYVRTIHLINDSVYVIGIPKSGVFFIQNNKRVDFIEEQHNSGIGIKISDNRILYYTGGVAYDCNFNNDTFRKLNWLNGLYNRFVNDARLFDGDLWIGTRKGIRIIKNFEAQEGYPEILHFRSVKINRKRWSIKKEYKLDYTQNNIRFSFTSITLKSAATPVYKYKLIGVDKDWVRTEEPFAQYTTLPPGEYTFKIKGLDNTGNWSDKAQTIKIIIEPPYWQTLWFRALIAVGVLILIVFIVYLIIRRIKKQNQLKEQISVSRQQALKAQMNPHFTFNTMNSIQYYIMGNDKEQAQEYLTKFSRLIRTTLENAEKELIPIEQEIETLETYLELEALRMENRFNYEITISNDIDAGYDRIPPMLLQPYIENSIWHGLLHKKDGEGLIQIDLKKKNNYIVCSIRDNGVGRQKAQELEKDAKYKHKSKGMLITNERLMLLNSQLNINLNVEVIDLFDANENPSGTEVKIKMPVK